MTPQRESTDSALLARLEEKLDNINIKIEDINKKLYGNGHPGIIVDQAIQNKKIDDLIEAEKKSCDTIKSLLESTPNKWLGKNWVKIVMFSILFLVFVHSFLPEDITIWQLIGLIK